MDQLAQIPLTLALQKAGLAAGTTSTLSTTATVPFAIGGKAYSKTAITNGATPIVDYATGLAFVPIPIPLSSPNLPSVPNNAAGYGGIFTVGFDHSGNVKVIQGQITALDASGNFITAPQFGGLGPDGSGSTDNDFCPIGYIIVKLGSTAVATWTFGTNNLSAVTGVTYVFQDVITLPGRPQIS